MKRFTQFAWFVLGWNLLVILWGAFVRATGSGAGCGSHWPLCNGQVLPLEPRLETIIEFTHRITSGLALLFVLILVVWAYRAYPKGSIVRLGATLSILFEITEALVGALLVLFEWVAGNVSMGRVVSISVHLVNTFLLIACLAVTAWGASGGRRLRFRGRGLLLWALGVGAVAILILGVTGAITALGDTLFPVQSLAEGIKQDFSPTAHFLVQLRVWHPVVAIVTGFYLAFTSLLIAGFQPRSVIKQAVKALLIIFGLQFLAGITNLILLAPVWMQLIHLFIADMAWIAFIIFSATTLQDLESQPSGG